MAFSLLVSSPSSISLVPNVPPIFLFYFLFFLAFGFFIPTTTANDLRLRRIFYPRCYPLPLFSKFLIKEPVFYFWMFSAKQGNYWYHFYNVFGMTRSLTNDWTRDLPHSKQLCNCSGDNVSFFYSLLSTVVNLFLNTRCVGRTLSTTGQYFCFGLH